MKFGIFYELQLPRPWTEESERILLKNAVTQIELADKLGYDYAWAVEHYFLEEYSHCASPEVFLGAACQRTKNIRLGHGVIQTTTNQPTNRTGQPKRLRPWTCSPVTVSNLAWAKALDRPSCILSAPSPHQA